MKPPRFLQDLISAPAYADKNSTEYTQASKYMELLYPGTVQIDATGKMIRPPYDMTLEQFEDTQAKIEEDIRKAKKEAEQELNTAEDGSLLDEEPDNPPAVRIVLKELVDVKVLMSDDSIIIKQLKIYDLEIISNEPDDEDEPEVEPHSDKRQTVWRWHSEDEENTCDECASRNGEIFWTEEDIPEIPVHPNCRCNITEDVIDEDGTIISSKPYKNNKQKAQNMNDKNFEQAYNKLKEPEGGYTNGKNQVRDEPTNMGIKQSTMDKYATKHPESDMPSNVKDLTPAQAKEIYKAEYWDNTQIPRIENDRIRNAVFDMNVMGAVGAGKSVQNALNIYSNAGLKVDGVIGSNTVKALNAIPENKVNEFMDTLKQKRIKNLQGMPNWPTSKNGWLRRTNAY